MKTNDSNSIPEKYKKIEQSRKDSNDEIKCVCECGHFYEDHIFNSKKIGLNCNKCNCKDWKISLDNTVINAKDQARKDERKKKIEFINCLKECPWKEDIKKIERERIIKYRKE